MEFGLALILLIFLIGTWGLHMAAWAFACAIPSLLLWVWLEDKMRRNHLKPALIGLWLVIVAASLIG